MRRRRPWKAPRKADRAVVTPHVTGAHAHAMQALRAAGHHVRRVYSVTSPGDGDGVEEALFVTVNGELRRAVMLAPAVAGGLPRIGEVSDGW